MFVLFKANEGLRPKSSHPAPCSLGGGRALQSALPETSAFPLACGHSGQGGAGQQVPHVPCWLKRGPRAFG